MRRQIAVVGSGVAGLTAAYVLQRDADVTLFEADARLGGHADTHELVDPSGRPLSVDTGFIVHNARTYPTLLRLFAELDVETQDSEMSMSISCSGCGLEYAGARGVAGLFPTVANLARPRYLYLLTEVKRFHRQAHALLGRANDEGLQTLGEFLDQGRFSRYFRAHFATPVISAVWSCSPELALQYPARYLFEFLDNHGMLSVTGSPTWRTVVGGSARYVERAAKHLSAVSLSTPVRAVTRVTGGVEITDDADGRRVFDGAVIATHPGQALAMLAAPTAAQSHALGAIGYSVNPTLLHTDTSVLPRNARAHASWNYRLPACDAGAAAVQVTYDMNRLQRLDSQTRYLVSLNSAASVDSALVLDEMNYEHPIFTPTSVAAQRELADISDDVLAFAGAYHGWGFHEDGARSGVRAAERLGVSW